MWTPLRLSAPVGALSFPASIATLSVDPWRHGVGQGEPGHYKWLSFPNAVEFVVSQLGGRGDAILAIGMAAASLPELAANLATLSTGFPLPAIGQVARRVASLATLETDKFALPALMTSAWGSMPLTGLPTLRGIRTADLLQASEEAIASLPENPLSVQASLEAAKTARNARVSAAMTTATAGLYGGAVPGGWRCYAESDHAGALRTGMPGHDFGMSVLHVFHGPAEDLSTLRKILDAVP